MKKNNLIAKELRTQKFRTRIVPNQKKAKKVVLKERKSLNIIRF